jgi:hypothetical protein
MKTTKENAAQIAATPARSAWQRGVKLYAIELLQKATENAKPLQLVNLLNGAENWRAFSYGGNGLIYSHEICARLCSPSEVRKNLNGERSPNKNETWLDCQTRALSQAARLIEKTLKN